MIGIFFSDVRQLCNCVTSCIAGAAQAEKGNYRGPPVLGGRQLGCSGRSWAAGNWEVGVECARAAAAQAQHTLSAQNQMRMPCQLAGRRALVCHACGRAGKGRVRTSATMRKPATEVEKPQVHGLLRSAQHAFVRCVCVWPPLCAFSGNGPSSPRQSRV